jgi:phage terminase small subunit
MSETPDHYNMQIQPIEFIVKNNIPFREANIIKYVCRHRDKDSIDDLLKAQHYLQMLIDEWEAENEEFKTPTLAEQLAEQEKKKQEKIAANKECEHIVKGYVRSDGIIIQEVEPGVFKRRESINPDADDIID